MNARVVRASGTAASLSATPAVATFGTKSPAMVFGSSTGTRTLLANCVVDLSGCILTEARTLTLQLRRTNHTPVNVPNSQIQINLPVQEISGESPSIPVTLPACTYTLSGQAGDNIVLWAHLDDTAGIEGTVQLAQAQIVSL